MTLLDRGVETSVAAFDVIDSLLSHQILPSEQVESAEALLVRMQAVPRLIGFLPIVWGPNKLDEASGRSYALVHTLEWPYKQSASLAV